VDYSTEGATLQVSTKNSITSSWKKAVDIDREATKALREKMTVIDQDKLDMPAFKQRARQAVQETFGNTQVGLLYNKISAKDYLKDPLWK